MSVAPPRPKDLPLNALRAFEAAARLGGFAAAGLELGVTPGAISSHIKTLEAELGADLFARTARGVELTGLGRRVLPGFSDAFDALGDAVRDLRDNAAPDTVHIATLPSVAQLWLSPRLPELRARMPGLSVSVTAVEAPPNLKRTAYDLCLFFDETGGRLVEEDWIFPVCAPGFAQALTEPSDISRVPCITDTTWPGDWAAWSRAVGQPLAPHGPVYSLYALALAEAVNGAGVMMGHLPLVRDHLERGALVAPFEARVRSPRALRVRGLSGRLSGRGAAARVADWLAGTGA